MRGEYPEIEPYEHGMLAVGDGNRLYWETCGNSSGKPALVLHGGPGSGCTPWHRRMFDPRAYRIVLFDQRNCGRSTPHASEPAIDLTSNTTQSLIADIEQLREHLGIDRWLVWGGSWGCTLALAYAECHPAHVTEMILWGVTNSRRREFDWLYSGWQQGGGLAALYPEQWARFRAVVPAADQNSDLAVAYARLLSDPDPEVHQRAAEEWCRWESAGIRPAPPSGLAEHFRDPRYALAFARIVTNCFAHAAWLEEGVLLRNLHRLAGIPAIMAQGERDLGAPLGTAWEMAQAWPRAELVIVENAGHDPSKSGMVDALIRAADHFARF